MRNVENAQTGTEGETRKVYAGCRSCHLNCPVWVTVKDGRAVKVEGEPKLGPPNMGKACVRASEAIQFEYSPTRLRYPLKRAGKRGEGKWERVSWDQAVDEIAAKIHEMVEKYGAETFVLPGRTGRHDMGWVAHRIARTIGTPNNYYGAIQVCYLPQFHEQVNYGFYTATGGGSAATKCHVSFSAEQAYAWPIQAQTIMANKENGMKLIVVDPVQGVYASKADEWVPVRPGTDVGLIMGMAKVIIDKGLYDKDYVVRWSNAPFLVRGDTGGLLLESDIVEGGSDKRFMVWDEKEDRLKYWDAEEIQWEGGPSGKAHYDHLVELFEKNKTSTEKSPAADLPDSIMPALFGEHEVELCTRGGKITCIPAFQMLANNVAEWTPEHTESITGVPADQVERVATMIGTLKPVDINQGMQYMSTNVSQYVNAINVLKIITGSVDVAGGNVLGAFYPVTPHAFPSELDLSWADGLPLEQKRKRLGYYTHRVGCGYAWEEMVKWQPIRPQNADGAMLFPDLTSVMEAAETGRPYPVHGIIAISSNWLMHDPTLARWLKLLEDETKIELHVVTDVVMTPTAEMADYVLPAVTWMERNFLNFGTGGGSSPLHQAYNKAVEPLCEARHDYDFGAMLSKALGKYDKRYVEGRLNHEWTNHWAGEYGKFWPADTIDGQRDLLSREFLGMPFEDVLKRRVVAVPGADTPPSTERFLIAGKFPTDTGKANLFSTIHQKCGYPPLPVYVEPAESPLSRPDLAKDYPLVGSYGKRQAGFFHSEFRQLPWTREMTRTPDVFINPETAAQFGVAENDWIWVESPPTGGRAPYNKIMGKVSFRFMVAPGIVSYSQHAWWRPEKTVEEELHGAFEWNTEALIEVENNCPETGSGGYRSQICRIYKATEEDIARYQPEITREQLEALMPMTPEECAK